MVRHRDYQRLEAVSSPSQGDHEAGNEEEGLIDAELSVVANGKMAEVSEPGICLFDLLWSSVTMSRPPILSCGANASSLVRRDQFDSAFA